MTATALAAVGSNANENGTLLISGTAVSASGTSVNFTDIPSWAKRITVMFNGVSTNGTSSPLIQIGAGSVTTSGYLSQSAFAGATNNAGGTSSTAGFILNGQNAVNLFYGQMILTNITSNTWVAGHSFGINASGTIYSLNGGGTVTLGGALDRVRITTVNGTDTFDAGTINIFWE